MKILNRLYEVKDLDKIRKKFFVFDCETFSREARPEGFAFCCMYGYKYKKVFHSIAEFQEELFSGKFKNKYIFCHFAEFDLNVIFGNIKKELDRECVINGSRFIVGQRDKVMFADSFNIYQTGVKKIGEILGLNKLEMDSRFGQGKKFKYTQNEIDYCYRDCEIVWLALEKIFTMVQSVRPTLASLSMLYYRRFYMPFSFAYNDLSIKFFDSYYGGRVEAFKLGKTVSSKYDINSMYPYVMTFAKFPNPKFVKESHTQTVKGLLHDLKYYEGQATIKVEHKANNFGFLPVKKDGKLIFPNGIFSGTWCFPEIRYALKKKVIKILEVGEVLISYPMESPFKKFAIETYEKRLKAVGIEKDILKIILNANYGKWGQREKFKEIYFETIPLDFIELLQENKIPFQIKTFNKKRLDCYLHIYAPIKINKDYTEIKIDESVFKTKIHSIPAFSSYITSHARVYLLESLLKYQNKSVTYIDTDCICVEKDVTIIDSLELGAFKKEKEFLIEIFGNKNYSEMKNGVVNRKIKGIPKKAEAIGGTYDIKSKELILNNTYQFDTFVKTKRAIRQEKKAGSIEIVTKTLTNEYTKRIIKENGKTSPLFLTV